ncbi:MAG: flagellar hook-associated protein 3 [Gallionellaceae bacterium]|nr:MAG: flagellar hook-associated protein 3 [Gallionellaceae bacterium]
MRVSSGSVFDTNVAMLNQQQSTLLHTNQQVASGRRMLTPADDPSASANALQVSQAEGTNAQFTTNRNAVKSSTGMAEAVLQSVSTLLTDAKTMAVQAGNGTLSPADRQSVAGELQGRLDQLIALANSTDGTGNYLFSGFQGKTIPFVNTSLGVQYMADDGQRMIQVSSSRQMAASDSGADIFMRVKNGNGIFVTEASASNTGAASIGQGSVTNATQLTGSSYELTFTGPTTYTVTETTQNGEVLPPVPVAPEAPYEYVSGEAFTLPGMQLSIIGTPDPGDTFTVSPSTNEGLFKTLSDLIAALNTTNPAGTAATGAQLSSSLSKAMSGLDRGLDNVLTARASLGARLNELDSLQATGEDLGLQYKQTLSTLQDLDYNKAISDLNRQTTSLTAAQKSFKQIAELSMFNYM